MRLASFLRPLLGLVLCIAALPAAAQIYPGFDASRPIRFVYRVDATPPLDVFFAGFNTLGVNEDLLALTSGDACNNPVPIHGTAWVSMTADRQQAVRFAQRYLENTPWSGAGRLNIHIYEIRADASFISVPGAFYSAIDAGFGNRAGYAPEHANALEYLLYRRPILGEQAVVANLVHPRNIRSATALWLENGGLVESGSPIPNNAYIHDLSSVATNVVDDWRLPSLLSPYAILAAQGVATGTCAMLCNAPVWSRSFSSNDGTERDKVCSVSDAMSPLLFDIINDD